MLFFFTGGIRMYNKSVTKIGICRRQGRLSSGAGFGCGRKIAIYCWNDLRNRQNVLAFGGVVFAENGLLVIVHR